MNLVHILNFVTKCYKWYNLAVLGHHFQCEEKWYHLNEIICSNNSYHFSVITNLHLVSIWKNNILIWCASLHTLCILGASILKNSHKEMEIHKWHTSQILYIHVKRQSKDKTSPVVMAQSELKRITANLWYLQATINVKLYCLEVDILWNFAKSD